MLDDRTFLPRLAIGLAMLLALLVVDLRRRGRDSPRLREYAFLFGTTGIAMALGVGHDWITYAISPEYYVIGKGLDSAAGGFSKDVVVMALEASWSVGLVVGTVFLVANNPHPGRTPVTYGVLGRYLGLPLGLALTLASMLGLLVALADESVVRLLDLAWLGPESARRFATVWAAHTGTYVGVGLGCFIAGWRIRRLRFAAEPLRIAVLRAGPLR